MCIDPENEREMLQQCIASGQVAACQVVQHAAAGEYEPRLGTRVIKPPVGVYYDASTDLFRGAWDTCAMDNDFQVHWRDRQAVFPKTREEALEAFTAAQLKEHK